MNYKKSKGKNEETKALKEAIKNNDFLNSEQTRRILNIIDYYI